MLQELSSELSGRPLNIPLRTSSLLQSPHFPPDSASPSRPYLPLIPHFPCPLRTPHERKVVLLWLIEKASRGGTFSPRNPPVDIFFEPR